MKQDKLKEKFAEIKEESLDVNQTKSGLIELKKKLEKEYELCEGEASREEIWENFIEEYFKELEYRGNSNDIYNQTVQHVAIDRFINSEKADRYTYNEVMRKSRNLEQKNNMEPLYPSLNVKNTIITLIRSAIRCNPGITEKRIVQTAPEQKERIDSKLKKKLISNIQHYGQFMSFNGFLDEYIEKANNTLQELGLDNLKYLKRNPIADEEYDENDKLIKDKEDIGVEDVFETDFLEKMSIEELLLMNMAWEAQYFDKRLEMSRIIFAIDALNLYDIYANGSVDDIKGIEDEKIEAALKKDMALTYIYNAKKEAAEKLELEAQSGEATDFDEQAMDEVITSKVKRQYKKFLKENGLPFEDENIEESLRNLNGEFENIYSAGEDVSILQGIIVYLIENNAIKLKRWGTIDGEKIFKGYKSAEDILDVAIEHPGFRGPVVIEVPKNLLETINGTRGVNAELPKYKGYVDAKYCEIMSKLYVPATQFYKNAVKAEYKAEPSSKLKAALAGKSVREGR